MAAFIIYILRWGVVLTLLYSLYGLLMKRETLHGFNRVVLLVILIASMVLPLCQLETPRPNIVTKGRELLEQQILLEERMVKKEGDYWITDAETEYVSNIDRITNGALAYDKTPLRTKGWNWANTLLLLIEIYAVGVMIYWGTYPIRAFLGYAALRVHLPYALVRSLCMDAAPRSARCPRISGRSPRIGYWHTR